MKKAERLLIKMNKIVIKTQEEFDALQRLLSKTQKDRSLGCWNFIGAKSRTGYGNFRYKSEGSAHRCAYLLLRGKITKGKDVAHDCDNRVCVNPLHLRLLSRKQNMRDAVIRNRIKIGYEHKQSKLNKEQTTECLRLKTLGWSNSQIGKKLNVSTETIRRRLIRFS